MIIVSRCIGCGAIIQSNNPEQLGYVAEAILIERGKDVYCKRCYEIRNHNFQYEVDNNLHNYYEKMKIIKKEKALILLLIDIMDIMGGFIPNLDQCIGTNKVILVVNKIDLLPKDFKLTRLDKIIRNLALKDGLNLDSILYGSVKNKEFVHKIISKVTKIKYPNKSNPFTKRKVRFNNCYIVGHASVGKSTLMNQIGKMYLEYKTDVITTNSQFQTTLDFIQWPLDKDSFLIDTPGIINPHNFCAYLKGESLHIVMPKKYIKPRTFQLQPNQTIFLGGLVRLDFKGNESGPSGGLMLTIAIYDKLVSKDLTNGLKIVGTGTIDYDGNVGQIDGVAYKLKGAVKKGADIFIAPTGENYQECVKLKKKKGYKIDIIEAKTFEQVIRQLENYKK